MLFRSKDLKALHHTSMILITHDLGIVAEICDEVAVMYAGSIVEKGTLSDVFSNPCHPYTVGLFNSLPNINRKQKRLKPIPGLMPDPMDLPEGCSFAPRCPFVMAKCKIKPPTKIQLGETHMVLCTAYENPVFNAGGRV